MIKIEFLQVMSGEKVFRVGTKHDFEDEEAIRLVDADIAKPTNKKEYAVILQKIEEENAVQEEKEKKATALLYKDELEAERAKLQVRIDEVTDALGDAVVYYKTYSDLVIDLVKKKEAEDEGEGEK